MLKISNLHQPYIFYNNSKKFYIVSEILEDVYKIFHHIELEAPKWKLHILDENFSKKILTTPKMIKINNKIWNVYQECSGHIYDKKISYIVCVHTGEDNSETNYCLLKGDFDIEKYQVTNVKIVKYTEAGFIEGENIFWLEYKNKIFKNDNLLIDLDSYFESITRIMKIYDEHNKILITGMNENGYITLMYDFENNELYELLNKNAESIYKSSILGNEENGELVYTKKHFDKFGEPNYDLNFELGYKLNKLNG